MRGGPRPCTPTLSCVSCVKFLYSCVGTGPLRLLPERLMSCRPYSPIPRRMSNIWSVLPCRCRAGEGAA